MCLTYQAYVNLEYVGGGSRGQAGPDILMAAFYPDYCFLISLIGKPWIGGHGKMEGLRTRLKLRRDFSRLSSAMSGARLEVKMPTASG